MSSYIFKMLLLAMFTKLTIVLLESSLWFETLCIPLRGNIPLGRNSLFAACYRDVGRKITEND